MQAGNVSGQVIEEGTNTPVPGARVFLLIDGQPSAGADSPPATVTDRIGRYVFDALPAGRYHIAAQKDGFAPPMDPSMMRTFELATNQFLDGLNVVLQRGGAITGHIFDPVGQAQADVAVTALLKRLGANELPDGVTSSGTAFLVPFGESRTNDLGEFRIYGLPPGDYVVVANPRVDFGGPGTQVSSTRIPASTFFPGTADVSAAQPMTVNAGETVSDVTMHLVTVPAFQVSGSVVDESGAPVEETMVMLTGNSQGIATLMPLMTPSDARGMFVIGGVPAGSFTLKAVTDGSFVVDSYFQFVIDDRDGIPRTTTAPPQPEPGSLDVTVSDSNVTDLKIVVKRPR